MIIAVDNQYVALLIKSNKPGFSRLIFVGIYFCPNHCNVKTLRGDAVSLVGGSDHLQYVIGIFGECGAVAL